ncbi:mannosyl-oligosaccharide glucosidase GCS1-like [Hordeum vulgare subsp. vulgare]|nr:mannosyl-oligosaccharide glucosidase GCS1-like [Hordeum vulgare subsp. vulgare]
MTGGSRGTTRRPSAASRSGGDPSSSAPDPDARRAAAAAAARRSGRGDHGPLRLMTVSARTLLLLGIASVTLLSLAFLAYTGGWWQAEAESEGAAALRRMARSVTPLDAPRMMDLPQFQGDHKESLYWGTYRPNVYLGIRARTPLSLIAGLMWIGVKNGQYFIRHVCQDSDELSKYGWADHNGRDYGRQELTDHGLHLTTSFLKEKGDGSGYGGDWAVRLDAKNVGSSLSEAQESTTHLFFYIADEAGKLITMGSHEPPSRGPVLLASGSHEEISDWELYLRSEDNLEIHRAGFQTISMHNLSDLVQHALVTNARQSGNLNLPDMTEDSSNAMIYQISIKLPAKIDIVFLSGAGSKNPMTAERINRLTGPMLSTRLESKQKEFEERYDQIFNLNNKIVSKELSVGRAALSSLLGGIGYFYGQSKIALPKGFSQKNGDKYIPYWPAALYTAVPSRSFFPRGFLWDEGFHQLVICRWDAHISMDIIGHWLDLINADGWIPREQILGAEALSKVPEEFVLQYPSNGNPPTLFLALRDLASGIHAHQFSDEEAQKISTFLKRAYVRLNSWFQWFNSTQSGKYEGTFFWHGRDNVTTRELNPKTLTSGLDDYPRASHPNDEERHVDLRCWMLLATNCMRSIAGFLKMDSSLEKDYYKLSDQLSDFETLNKMHLDDKTGAYFDYGNHTEKVRLRWYEDKEAMKRELLRETLEAPQLQLVPHVGYVSLFPFMMGAIPPESWVLEKQLDLISNSSVLWTDYGLRSLSRTSSMYMKRNTEHDAPYWRGAIWINMNYMILSGLHHYAHEDGPYSVRAGELYDELRSNLIRNIVGNYQETGFFWENYDQKNRGKGKGARSFTGWTSLVVLIMAESYPSLHR